MDPGGVQRGASAWPRRPSSTGLTGERLPLGPLRNVLRLSTVRPASRPRFFAPPLAVYTAVLLADTATPTWNAAHASCRSSS